MVRQQVFSKSVSVQEQVFTKYPMIPKYQVLERASGWGFTKCNVVRHLCQNPSLRDNSENCGYLVNTLFRTVLVPGIY